MINIIFEGPTGAGKTTVIKKLNKLYSKKYKGGVFMLRLVPQSAKPLYEDVYNANYSKVVQYINKKIGNYADAEDLASEVFLYAYKHYEEFDPQKSSVNT